MEKLPTKIGVVEEVFKWPLHIDFGNPIGNIGFLTP